MHERLIWLRNGKALLCPVLVRADCEYERASGAERPAQARQAGIERNAVQVREDGVRPGEVQSRGRRGGGHLVSAYQRVGEPAAACMIQGNLPCVGADERLGWRVLQPKPCMASPANAEVHTTGSCGIDPAEAKPRRHLPH